MSIVHFLCVYSYDLSAAKNKGTDGWVSIIQSKSKGLVVGKCKIEPMRIQSEKHYDRLSRRHKVPFETMKTEVCTKFKDFDRTPIYGWSFTEVVRYKEEEQWEYSGNKGGNPTWVSLNGLGMSFNRVQESAPVRKRKRGKQAPTAGETLPLAKKLKTKGLQNVAQEEVGAVVSIPTARPKTEWKEGTECKRGCNCKKCRQIMVNGLTYYQRRKRTERPRLHGQQRGRPPTKKKEDKGQDKGQKVDKIKLALVAAPTEMKKIRVPTGRPPSKAISMFYTCFI